jgi:hypothetical protein
VRAGLSLPTVERFEGGFGPNVSEGARSKKLQRALEAAGKGFLDENGAGMGVRFCNHDILNGDRISLGWRKSWTSASECRNNKNA